MRIIFQGDMTPKQVGEAVKEILENTLEKAEVKGKRYPIHNPVVEFTLNLQGIEEPQLLIDTERGDAMFTVKTGFKNGEFGEFIPVDHQELVDKFNRMVDNAIQEEEDKGKSDSTDLLH